MNAETAQARPQSALDPASASFVAGRTEGESGKSHYTLTYQGHDAYTVTGYSDGSGTTCTCPRFTYSTRRPKVCKHCIAFVALIEAALEREYAGEPTPALREWLGWYAGHDTLTTDERLRSNAIRTVLLKRGVVRPVRERAATVARGRAAAAELYGE